MGDELVKRQVEAVIDAARNVEWEAHFGANWEARAAELAKARDHLLAFAARPAAPGIEGAGELAYHCEQARTYISLLAKHTPEKHMVSARWHLDKALALIERLAGIGESRATPEAATPSPTASGSD